MSDYKALSDINLAGQIMAEIELWDGMTFTNWERSFAEEMSELTGKGILLSPSQRRKLEEVYEERCV